MACRVIDGPLTDLSHTGGSRGGPPTEISDLLTHSLDCNKIAQSQMFLYPS